MTRSRALVLSAAFILLALVFILGAMPGTAWGAHVTERVSLSDSEGQADDSTDRTSVSTDGRYVVFESKAGNLVTGDTNGKSDVFLRDRLLGTTTRVSGSTSGAPANDNSYAPAISADGRYVAYWSYATNLVSGDTNGKTDVFVWDRVSATTTRVSRSTAGTQGNDHSYGTAISTDGRYVAFFSSAANLVLNDTNDTSDVFVYDVTLRTITRESVSSTEEQADNPSSTVAISADGRYVAFESLADNLVAGDTNDMMDIFVRDRVLGVTERVSVAGDGAQANSHCYWPGISATGRWVVWHTSADTLVADDALGHVDVFVRDRVLGTTERVSVSQSEAEGDERSQNAVISANGRYVAFDSLASNLAWGDPNGAWDVYVRDREAGTTTMVSVATDWTGGNGHSGSPAISADGRCVAFVSDSTNLVAGDTNAKRDAFLILNHALVDPSPVEYGSVRGSDRYDTAIKLSQAMFPAGLASGSGLVLAPGETFQEALCGAPLAAAYGGPVLLTYKTAIANNVRDEIVRLAPEKVICIGLAEAVVTAVDSALGTGGEAVAIEGVDIYDMSRKVAQAMQARLIDMHGGTAIITIGTNFPDAIGVAPLACSQLWPILLTDRPDDSDLHASAAAALTDLGLVKALKVGTYTTLPATIAGVGNCSGADRYVTNRRVAEWAQLNAGSTFAHIGVTTGEKFPDALASGPYLAEDDGVLLLSPLLGPLPPGIAEVIYANRAEVAEVTFIAMIEPVISLVKGLLP